MIVQANATTIPLADESVDLIVTSPPYFALRSYRDGDEHYAGQIGSEATPQDFLEALWAVTAEMKRVLKPSGSIFVNLGDKYAGSGGHNNAGISAKSTLRGNGHVGGVGKAGEQKIKATLRSAPDRYNQNSGGIPAKSLMGLPWRYAIGCIDQLGLILRAEIVWSKPNGLPESVTDRVRRSHEQWFHMTKQGRYFAGVDEVREAQDSKWGPEHNGDWGANGYAGGKTTAEKDGMARSTVFRPGAREYNPLGKLPGSVWVVPSEPLIIPAAVQEHYDLPDHFAAFPQELPRRIILGWSPSGICVECGEGRRPVVAKTYAPQGDHDAVGKERYARQEQGHGDVLQGRFKPQEMPHGRANCEATITGYACSCGIPAPPTRPAVILDPFSGTGTVVGVARALGRYGIGLDLSMDYCRLGRWRDERSGHFAKTSQRTHRENQADLFGASA